MKFRTLAIAALAAMSLAACSKDGDNGKGGAEATDGIFIQFTGLSNPNSRSTSAPVADQTPVTFKEGYLIFGDNVSDEVTHVVAITTSASSLPTVTIDALEKGRIFAGIEATHVYVLGNVEGLTAPAVDDVLSDLLATTVDVLDQTDATGGLTTATLYGVGQIDNASAAAAAAGADKEAIFTVKPLAARLELQKVTGDGSTAGKAIVSYKLAGVYVNNFYLSVGLNGSILNSNPWNGTTGNLVNFSDDYAKYIPTGGGYLPTWDGILFDGMTVADNTLVAAPAAGSVWAYNVLAPSGNAAVPNIVLHFTDMVVDFDNSGDGTATPSGTNFLYKNTETTTDGECYLTVTRYIENKGQANEADLAIDGGYVYKIVDVPFTVEDLGDLPGSGGEDGFKVYVEVDFMKWTAKSVTGGW